MDDQHYKIIKEERIESNKLYAIKLVERVVFGLVTLMVTAIVVALISLVVKG